jgi:hypothetical protein
LTFKEVLINYFMNEEDRKDAEILFLFGANEWKEIFEDKSKKKKGDKKK